MLCFDKYIQYGIIKPGNLTNLSLNHLLIFCVMSHLKFIPYIILIYNVINYNHPIVQDLKTYSPCLKTLCTLSPVSPHSLLQVPPLSLW
jgi:hypothetical protein